MKVSELAATSFASPTTARMEKLLAAHPDEIFTAGDAGVSVATFSRYCSRYPHHRVYVNAGSGSPRMMVGSALAIKALLKAMPERAFQK